MFETDRWINTRSGMVVARTAKGVLWRAVVAALMVLTAVLATDAQRASAATTTYVLDQFVVEDGKFELRMGARPYWGYEADQRIPTIPGLIEIVMGPIQVGETVSFARCRQSGSRSTVTHHMTVEALGIDYNLDDGRFGADPPGGAVGDADDPNNNCEFTFTEPGEYLIDDSTDPGEHGVAKFVVEGGSVGPIIVINTNDSGPGSLREAILVANARPGFDAIVFDIPAASDPGCNAGTGVCAIQPTSALPTITGPVRIDGYTQPGATPNTNGTSLGLNTVLTIELDGSLAGPGANGLHVTAGSSTVRGLVINRFNGAGIVLQTNGGNAIEGNFIGTDVTGTTATGPAGPPTPDFTVTALPETSATYPVGKDFDGFVSQSDDPLAPWSGTSVQFRGTEEGGSTETLGAASLVYRYRLEFDEVATLTSISVSGAAFNGPDRILRVLDESMSVLGSVATSGGNSFQTITVNVPDVQGTLFFIDEFDTSSTWRYRERITVNGPLSLGNGDRGIRINSGASNNTIGGLTTGARNLISANHGHGIRIADAGATGNVVQGNLIGTDVTGTKALGNTNRGVHIRGGASNNVVGGTVAAARNVISGNGTNGVFIGHVGTSGNVVAGNYVGTDVTGTAALGNGRQGVMIALGASDNVIGGTTASERNIISANRENGVLITDPGTDDNTVAGNYIGADVTGTVALGNRGNGVEIRDGAADNVVGGLTVGTSTTYVVGDFVVEDGKFELRMGARPYWSYGAEQRIPTIPGLIEIVIGPIQVGDTVSFARCRQSGSRSTVTHHMTVEALGIDYNLDDGRFGADPPGGAVGDADDPNNNCEFTFTAPGEYLIDDATDPGEHGIAKFIVEGEATEPVVYVLDELRVRDTVFELRMGDTTAWGYNAGDRIRTDEVGDITITINVGDSVVFPDGLTGSAANAETHFVTIDELGVNLEIPIGGDVEPGFTIAPTEPGTYRLYCSAHPDGHGNVFIVVEPVAKFIVEGAQERNVISGNDGDGVVIRGVGTDRNVIRGNYLGTDVTGAHALANNSGITIVDGAQFNTVGGTTPGERNVISGNREGGVDILFGGTEHNTVSGNYIGTDVTGTVAVANGLGIDLRGGSQSNTIGGTTAGERNVISGNDGSGVRMIGGAEHNVVSGNFIGTDVTGTAALGNNVGVRIEDASGNTIGGLAAGARNVISGNRAHGIRMGFGATGNVVQGNFIGTDMTGTVALGNGGQGVNIRSGASNNTVGGAVVAARNIISGNEVNGVHLRDAGTTGNVVQGNFIGTDVDGTADLGNAASGVRIRGGASDNLIGGSVAGERNVISANGGRGVLIEDLGSTDNAVSGNYIGTDVTGGADLGNGSSGVAIENGAQFNTVGGTAAGEGNIISNNDGPGVRVGTRVYVLDDFVVEDGKFELRMGERDYWGYRAFDRIPSSTVPPEIVMGPIEPGDTISFGRCRQSGNRSSQPHRMTIELLGFDHNLDDGRFGSDPPGGPIGNVNDPTDNCAFTFVAPGEYAIDDSSDPGAHGVAKIIVGVDDLPGATTYVLREFVVEDGKFELRMGETPHWGYDAFQRIQSTMVLPEIVMGPVQVGATISFDRCRQSGSRSTEPHHMTIEALGIDHNLDGFFGTGGGTVGIGGDPDDNCEFTFTAPGEYLIDDDLHPGAHGMAKFIVEADFVSPNGNAILGNSIFSNDDLGIDLGGDGVTPNDPRDGDTGANNLQNFPELTLARPAGGGITIHGDLDSTPKTTFRLEFFANASCDPSGHGEGGGFIGSHEFTTKARGNAVFKAVLRGPLPAGRFITATATDPDGNTSEFSACVAAIALGGAAQPPAGGPPPGTIPVPAGIVSWWPGDRSADDIIDGNHGTLAGGATFAPGLVGAAFSLDGADDYINAGTSTTLAPGLFTIELWMKARSVVSSGPATLASRWGHSTVDPNSWILDIQSDQRICITARNVSQRQQAVCSGTTLPILAWHHVAATYNGNTLTLYLDGQFSAQSSFSGTILTNPSTTSIGCKFAEGQCFFPFAGLIDEVALFDRALTADEIEAIHDAGSAGKSKAPPEPIRPPRRLVGWWSGDGHADDIVDDNHGTFDGIYALGKVDLGFRLDGTDHLILVPDSAELDITGDVTVDLWARRSTFGSATLLAKGAGRIATTRVPTAYRLFFGSQDWLIGGFQRADGSGVFLIGPSVNDSEFHHYAYVRSGNAHELFVDGAVVASGTFTGSPGDTSGLPLTIGARRSDSSPTGFTRHFGGTIDEVEIFDRALSDAEIKAIYDAGSAGKIKPAPHAILNGSFETGDLIGWTASGINGGFATVNQEETCFSFNNTLGLTLNGNFAANVRSSGPAPTNSIGILTSDPFAAGPGIAFRALSENDDLRQVADPVTLEVRLLDGLGNILLSQTVVTNIVTLSLGPCPQGDPRDGVFSTHVIDTSAFAGQMVQLQFRQHTDLAGSGFFTLIDDVDVIGSTT